MVGSNNYKNKVWDKNQDQLDLILFCGQYVTPTNTTQQTQVVYVQINAKSVKKQSMNVVPNLFSFYIFSK